MSEVVSYSLGLMDSTELHCNSDRLCYDLKGRERHMICYMTDNGNGERVVL